MELQDLKILVEVVRAGGFTAAAKSLGSTQSTVSKALARLEHDCGARLLERLPGDVRPTESGRLVLRRATAMLAEQESLEAELAAAKGLETGTLRIGLPPLGASQLFPPLIARFRQRYPAVRIDLREEGSHALAAAVQGGEIEIGASLLPVAEGFATRLICDEPIEALLPADHPLANRDQLAFAELAGERGIFFERGFALNSVLEAAAQKRRMSFIEAARSGYPDFILALVAAGVGVAFLPRLIVARELSPAIRAVPLKDRDLRWKLGLIWRKHASLSPPAQRWMDLVRELYPTPGK